MIDGVDGSIVDLQLRQFEVQEKWFLHNLRDKGRLAVIPFVGKHRGAIIVEDLFYFLIQLLIELLESSFKITFTDSTSLGVQRRSTSGGRVMTRLWVWRSPPDRLLGPKATLMSQPSL